MSSPGIPILGQPLKLPPCAIHPLCFSLQIATPGVSCLASLSLSLWVPGQGLTCDNWSVAFRGCVQSIPVSLEDFIFCWLLLGLFPEFSVADSLRSLDLKDSSKAGVDEFLDLLQCGSRGSPCFSSIQQNRFYCGVKVPDFDVAGQVR